MQCPHCYSNQTFKNGRRKNRQCYKCKQCYRQFLDSYLPWGYSNDIKQLCLEMHLSGMSLRKIQQLTNIHHTTILHWVRKARMKVDEISD